MAKYIIEPSYGEEIDTVMCFMNGRAVEQINYVEEYTEPDREAIENEVWNFATMLLNMHPDVAEDIYRSMNGGKGIGVAAEMTYQEAKERYDAWKKKKEEIRVGDEVIVAGTTGVVVRIPEGDEQRIHFIAPSGTVYCNNAYADIVKTGRHFPEVAELLKKMREES